MKTINSEKDKILLFCIDKRFETMYITAEIEEKNLVIRYTHFPSFYQPKKDSYCFNLYDELDKDMLDEIHEFIENSDTINVENAHIQPYIYKKCGKIESNIYFKITDLKTGKTYSPKYKCECGNRLKKLTTKELKHLCCSKCGIAMEEVSELYMLWD